LSQFGAKSQQAVPAGDSEIVLPEKRGLLDVVPGWMVKELCMHPKGTTKAKNKLLSASQ
jgi:hypothetical protein